MTTKIVRTKQAGQAWETTVEPTGGGGGGDDLATVLSTGNDAGAQQITNLADGSTLSDAATLQNINDVLAFLGLNAVLSTDPDAGGITLQNIGDAVDPQDAVAFHQLGAVTTLTSVVEAQSPTFEESVVFDLGSPKAWYAVISDLVVVPDGETFAPADAPTPGQLWVDLEGFSVSADGVTFVDLDQASPWLQDIPGDQATSAFAAYGVTPRYLRATNFRIIDSDSFAVYAGANDPTATATLTVTA